MRLQSILLLAAINVFTTDTLLCAQVSVFYQNHTVEISPADISEPALVHSFKLNPNHVTRDNAAVIYNRALATISSEKELLSGELNTLIMGNSPKPETNTTMDRKLIEHPVYVLLSQASKCDRADWELPTHTVHQDELLIPDIIRCRTLARLLVAKSMIHLADDNVAAAIETQREILSLAQHLTQSQSIGPTIVSTEACEHFLRLVAETQRQQNAPNQYWALSTLSPVLLDVESSVRGELYSLERSFPELNKITTTKGGVQYWNERLLFFRNRGLSPAAKFAPGETSGLLANLIQVYPQAKQRLSNKGWSDQVIEEMCSSQVVLLDSYVQYQKDRDAFERLSSLPIDHAYRGMVQQLEESRVRFKAGMQAACLSRDSYQKIASVYGRLNTNHCDLTILRTIEAIRAFYARHNSLPKQLADITFVPLPLDHTTRQPLVYDCDGESATMTYQNYLGHESKIRISFRRSKAK